MRTNLLVSVAQLVSLDLVSCFEVHVDRVLGLSTRHVNAMFRESRSRSSTCRLHSLAHNRHWVLLQLHSLHKPACRTHFSCGEEH